MFDSDATCATHPQSDGSTVLCVSEGARNKQKSNKENSSEFGPFHTTIDMKEMVK